MKHLIIAAVTGLISLTAQAQVSETRALKEVTSIEVKNGIEVIFTQSDTLALKVEANNPENLYSIATDYSGHKLKIYIKSNDGTAVTNAKARVYVSQKNVTDFRASNAAVIRVNGTLTTGDTNISLSSGATLSAIIVSNGLCKVDVKSGSGFRGKITTDKLDATIMAGSYMKVNGTANSAKLFCSGGYLTADKFVCNDADVWAKNASAVSIFTKNSITTDVDTSSSITYYGEPAKTSLGSNTYAVKRDNYKLSLN